MLHVHRELTVLECSNEEAKEKLSRGEINAHEFELMVGLGMKPMDAILAGTRNAAELLGLEKTLGTIEAGKVADLVAVDDNPLDGVKTLTAPSFVMHEGKVVAGPAKLLR